MGEPTAAEHGSAKPSVTPVPCSSCGGPVDPLRAARVAHIRERFRYFCSADCLERFDPRALRTPLPNDLREVLSAKADDPESADDEAAHHLAGALAEMEDVFSDLDASVRGEQSDEDDKLAEAAPIADAGELADATDVGSLLLAFAILGASLAIALALAGSSTTAMTARVVVACVACAALSAQYVMGSRDPTEPHPLALLSAPVAAALLAVVALIGQHPRTTSAIALSAVATAATAAGIWLMRRARAAVEAERDQIAAVLAEPAHRVVADRLAQARATDLRPGEEIIVEQGETIPADATITAGSATILPWLGAKSPVLRAEGETIVAGGRVLDGRLRAVVAWTGYDRAWARLTPDPRRRADVLAPLGRWGRLTAERGAPFAAGLAALTTFAANQPLLEIAMAAIGSQAAIANAGLAEIGALTVARTVLEALRRGIAFRTADAFDRAGRVSCGVFCARGTLLLGEPEVANIETTLHIEPQEVLALVAGAESGSSHPVANAVLRAARVRGVRPDAVRSPAVQAGLGVTAIASNGQSLVVGNRALMLKERITVATVESKITDLEAMGRTVLLVALGERLIGVVGLQDGLRPGARAAVQHLLDVAVEPVLVSGDARETCDALGRALDIEHIRPELLPTERGDEIRRLADGGATVAVIGRSPIDDAALAAADVSVALSAAGSSAAEWSVQLVSDDVGAAAYSIRLAHNCRAQARRGLILTLAAGGAAVLAVAFGLCPSWVAPATALAGSAAALAFFMSRPPSPAGIVRGG